MPRKRPETDDLKLDAFAAEYTIDFNAGRAAQAVGVSKVSARNTAWRWLQDPRVQQKIGEILAVRARQNDLEAEHVIGQYKAIALADITDVVSWCNEVVRDEGGQMVTLRGVIFAKASHELPPHVRAAIKSVKQTSNGIDVVMHDKHGALEKLEAYLRMEGAVKKHMLVGADGGAIKQETTIRFQVVDPDGNPLDDGD
jgi:hypothetical protein